MRRHLNNLRVALGLVFRHPAYPALAVTFAMVAFLLAVWLPNLGLLGDLFFESDVPLSSKLAIAFTLLGGIATNFSPLAAGYTVAIAVLFGVAVAMIVYLLKQRRLRSAGQNVAIGSGAMASGWSGSVARRAVHWCLEGSFRPPAPAGRWPCCRCRVLNSVS